MGTKRRQRSTSTPPESGDDRADSVNARDDRVKIPLPFEDALRGLLATEPDGNGSAEKQPADQPPKPRRR